MTLEQLHRADLELFSLLMENTREGLHERLSNGFSEEGDEPPMLSNPISWRSSYDIVAANGHLLATSFLSDVITWIAPSGEVSFLHKGSGGADDLPGAYNIESDPSGRFVYVASRNSVGVAVGSLAVDPQGVLQNLPFSLVPSEQWGAGALVNVYVGNTGSYVYGVDGVYFVYGILGVYGALRIYIYAKLKTGVGVGEAHSAT